MSTEDAQQRWQAALMNTYGTPPIALARGAGAQVWDVEGSRYLDLLGGVAVNVLGHAHPAVVEAVSTQIRTLGQVSNFAISEPAVQLAETLLDLLGATDTGRVLLCNSGAEANEVAFKIARRTGRRRIVSTAGSFHGRTMGALALTGQPGKREPFEPMPAGVEFVPYGDAGALASMVDGETAAVVLEPVQGEGGVVVPPADYLPAAREITARHGALLVLDEVQTGIGRTGAWFAHQGAGISPDVVTLAKGLGGGLPIGACIGIGDAAQLLGPGQHGTTLGGNPVCCAAALAVVRTIAADGLLSRTAALGKEIAASIEDLGHPLVDHVRGAGLLIGIALAAPRAAEFTTAARNAGFLVNPVQPDIVRLAPPLVLTDAQAREFHTALPGLLDGVHGG